MEWNWGFHILVPQLLFNEKSGLRPTLNVELLVEDKKYIRSFTMSGLYPLHKYRFRRDLLLPIGTELWCIKEWSIKHFSSKNYNLYHDIYEKWHFMWFNDIVVDTLATTKWGSPMLPFSNICKRAPKLAFCGSND